jgi:hypothetical protein
MTFWLIYTAVILGLWIALVGIWIIHISILQTKKPGLRLLSPAILFLLLFLGLALPVRLVCNFAETALGSVYQFYEMKVDEETRSLLAAPRYQEPLQLNRSEAKIYSQGWEDGIIREIFNRIGTTNKTFMEFGSADGMENNTVHLLRQGWNGLWIDGDPRLIDSARRYFADEIRVGRLHAMQSFITAENIESLFKEAGVLVEPDLLSIDIDFNDYWIWKAVTSHRPRVVVIEYNAIFPAGVERVIKYDPSAVWDQTSHYGVSLTSLELLGLQKGYSLVACSMGGNNSFFVRDDMAAGKFLSSFTAENHYEPPRYYLEVRQACYRRRP